MSKIDKMKTITWGIIGVGDVCEKKSAPAMYKLPGSKVKTVMRRNRDKAADYSKRHNIPFYFDRVDPMLNDPEIDIVYIATPPSSHKELALKVAAAGKPAYVEKPMAASYRDCMEMNEAFKKAELPLFVAYYRRTLPNFLKIKELIEEGAIGEVRTVNILMNKEAIPDNVRQLDYNWRVIPEIAGGGYFYDLASHQLDFLDFLFGPVREARGIASNQAGLYKAEDVVSGSFIFENGVVGSGSWCFTASKSADNDKTTIVGSKGQIEYATFGDSAVKLITDDNGEEVFDFELPEHIQQNLIQTILDEMRGKGKCPSTGVTGARTNQVMEWIVG
ncbi:MAG: Gfo/Idh/MocA family protein [Bacteroidales bacterium]